MHAIAHNSNVEPTHVITESTRRLIRKALLAGLAAHGALEHAMSTGGVPVKVGDSDTTLSIADALQLL